MGSFIKDSTEADRVYRKLRQLGYDYTWEVEKEIRSNGIKVVTYIQSILSGVGGRDNQRDSQTKREGDKSVEGKKLPKMKDKKIKG